MLIDMQKVISMARLTRDAERIADDIEEAGTVYRIQRRGRRSMLLMDQEYFEGWVATVEFMQLHPNWEQELAEARTDFDEGRCKTLDEVRVELGLDRSPLAKRVRSTRRTTRRRRR